MKSQPPASDPPPIGVAPDGQDFAHPWIVSAIISALSFGVGFVVLHLTGWWEKILQWADAPFLFYFAILMPVIVGFCLYGVYRCVSKLVKSTPPRGDS